MFAQTRCESFCPSSMFAQTQCEKFWSSFFKSLWVGRAKPSSTSAEVEIPQTAFFFCKLFFLRLWCQKEKWLRSFVCLRAGEHSSPLRSNKASTSIASGNSFVFGSSSSRCNSCHKEICHRQTPVLTCHRHVIHPPRAALLRRPLQGLREIQ